MVYTFSALNINAAQNNSTFTWNICLFYNSVNAQEY